MSGTDLDRAVSFLHAFARRRAERVVEVPGGFVVLDRTYPASYDHNKLIVTGTPPPAEVSATVEAVLGALGMRHRMVLVDDDRHGRACAPALLGAGYQHDAELVMVHSGTVRHGPDRAAIRVERLGLADLAESSRREWRERLPDADEETVEQLVERRATLLGAADHVEFLGVRDEAGKVLSRADLYADPLTGTAQIEDLVTDPAHTGRGLAGAILADALRRAGEAGCDHVFLVADAEDWPQRWYRTLGFLPVGTMHLFTRPAPKA